MKTKKILVAGIATLVIAGTFSVTVFAGGFTSNETATSSDTNYPLCTVETCTRVGYHTHSGATYAPHHRDDGHGYHTSKAKKVDLAPQPTAPLATASAEVCPVQECTQAGGHAHNGILYAAHHAEDGHAYHRTAPTSAPTYQGICPIERCAATGNHTHEGGLHGQHHNEDGHPYHGQQAQSSSGSSGGGHGSHHGGGGHH